MNEEQAIERMIALGWLPEGTDITSPSFSPVAAIIEYQQAHDLLANGELNEATVNLLSGDFGVCGSPEQYGDGTPALTLQTNRLLVFVRDALPAFDRDTIWSWLDEAYNQRWGAVCDFKARRIGSLAEASSADYVNLITVADLGGSGVLADQMLPHPGGRVLQMRINTRIRWTPTDGRMAGGIDPKRTLTHEAGHALGHQHWPVGDPSELMEPTVSNTIIGPQPTEAAVSARWFGKPTVPPPVPGKPTASSMAVFDQNQEEMARYKLTRL